MQEGFFNILFSINKKPPYLDGWKTYESVSYFGLEINLT
jgi:hypothetical protein